MAQDIVMKPVRALTWSDAASDELSLVQRCAEGDEDACTQLVGAHQRMVYQLSLHLLGDHNEALDLSQEVFLRVFRTIRSFRGQSALKTWIYRIVINQASNRQRWWRRRRRAQQVSFEQHVEAHGELPGMRRLDSPEVALRQKELAEHIQCALDKLPFDQRTVIVLREIDGLSYDEIAFSLNVAIGTVKSRLARAREQLRAELRQS